MALPNNDELEGKWEQTKGSVKEGFGNLTGDRQTQAEGQVQQAEGETQEGWGAVKRNVGETLENIGDAITGKGKDVNR
ncbi:MAG: CsbD family protein [Pyrinomonadaceae bacterium]|nr:CsbD family protein [Pyrinomonadaceae bacterium]